MLFSKKLTKLRRILGEMNSVLVAYTGGVDSAFLLKVSRDVLGDRAVAVTGVSKFLPKSEVRHARRLARLIRARHILVNVTPSAVVLKNSPQRCYYCKKALFMSFKRMAVKMRLAYVVDGSNVDDIKDYRPGSKACVELGVRSPLREAGISKSDIRRMSKAIGLPAWNKPAAACLASRFPYGQRITPAGLARVEAAEEYLKKFGVDPVRVRVHGDIARIEVCRGDMSALLKDRDSIIRVLRKLGFSYITLDMEGYRQGSMNEESVWKRKRY